MRLHATGVRICAGIIVIAYKTPPSGGVGVQRPWLRAGDVKSDWANDATFSCSLVPLDKFGSFLKGKETREAK